MRASLFVLFYCHQQIIVKLFAIRFVLRTLGTLRVDVHTAIFAAKRTGGSLDDTERFNRSIVFRAEQRNPFFGLTNKYPLSICPTFKLVQVNYIRRLNDLNVSITFVGITNFLRDETQERRVRRCSVISSTL